MSWRAKEEGCHPLLASLTKGLAARISSWVNFSCPPPLAAQPATWSETHARANALILSSTIRHLSCLPFIPRPTKLTSTYVRAAAWRNLRVRLVLGLV